MPDFLSPGFLMGEGGDVPTIHEDSDQAIQGGTTGEHYHLTEDQHTWAETYSARPFRYEPVCSITGVTMHASVGKPGDILMSPVTGY
jgi:hypothetical protein